MEDSTKFTRTLRICDPIRLILVLVLNGCFLQQAVANFPVIALTEQLNDMQPSGASKGHQRASNVRL